MWSRCIDLAALNGEPAGAVMDNLFERCVDRINERAHNGGPK